MWFFSQKNMHFYLKTAFLRVFFLQKQQRQKSVANPKEITSAHYGQTNVCTCLVLLTFAIAIPFEKLLIFIENTEISRVFFTQKLQKKAISPRSWRQKLSKLLESIIYICPGSLTFLNAISFKKYWIFTWNTAFLENFFRKNFKKNYLSRVPRRKSCSKTREEYYLPLFVMKNFVRTVEKSWILNPEGKKFWTILIFSDWNTDGKHV